MTPTDVWVLTETVADDYYGRGVRICGTTYSRSAALLWVKSRKGDIRGAFRVPLDGLAEGEVW